MEKNEKSADYAILKACGKQYRVSEGDKIKLQAHEGKVGESLTFSEILLVNKGGNLKIGKPLVEGATVKAKVLAQDRDKKIVIYKKNRRTGFTKKQGHRQDLSTLQIESIKA